MISRVVFSARIRNPMTHAEKILVMAMLCAPKLLGSGSNGEWVECGGMPL